MSDVFSPFFYHRRLAHEVKVGNVGVGGTNPIRIQSMTVADTMDTAAVVAEARGLIEAGCEIVRITAPTIHHAENLKNIRDQLRQKGYQTPLVADIHFTPQAALIAADYVEKVRINPGNYADRKLFAVREYTDSEYDSELQRLHEKFLPLVRKCKERGVAMRIGTNHGSLSDRILNRYGDTPLGMVESALEFLRICEDEHYFNVILSMKASNTQVMVQAYRLLAAKLQAHGLRNYPLHLGVTEAGDGEDGRIKSAVGILTLLEDGIGDTIRVSLTEDSIHEIPVARDIVEKFNRLICDDSSKCFLPPSMGGSQREGEFSINFPLTPTLSHHGRGDTFENNDSTKFDISWNPYEYIRRPSETVTVGPTYVGGKHVIRVAQTLPWNSDPQWLSRLEDELRGLNQEERFLEILSFQITEPEQLDSFLEYIPRFRQNFPKIALGADLQDAAVLIPQLAPVVDLISVAPAAEKNQAGYRSQAIEILRMLKQWPVALEWKLAEAWLPSFAKEQANFYSMLLSQLADWSVHEGVGRFSLCWAGKNWIHENRFLRAKLDAAGLEVPIHLVPPVDQDLPLEKQLLEYSGQLGSLLLDGWGDSVEVGHFGSDLLKENVTLAYNILQGTRQRLSKTEFIACPSCGRTLFDLQTTTARIKKITSHLKGVKIAIMGCIVNGPGEMADADFGYVGGGPNKIHLYVGKECVEKNVPQEIADQRLVELIKEHGRWVEPK